MCGRKEELMEIFESIESDWLFATDLQIDKLLVELRKVQSSFSKVTEQNVIQYLVGLGYEVKKID